MFAKKYRITKKTDFENIFKNGRNFHSSLFILKSLKNNFDFNRFSVLVSKKISQKAVDRNLIKRKIKAIIKKQIKIFPENYDFVFYTKKPILEKEFSEIESEIIKLFKK